MVFSLDETRIYQMKFYGRGGDILRIGGRTKRFAGRVETFDLDADEELYECEVARNQEFFSLGARWVKWRRPVFT